MCGCDVNASIIDCHIHPAADADTDVNWFGTTGDFGRQVEALRRIGICGACGSVIHGMQPKSFDEVRALNDAALRLRDRFPDFYTPGIHVHPHFPDESCAEIERRCGGEGVRWIGELVGYSMGYAEEYATRSALVVMKTAAAYGAVVNIHCSDLKIVAKLCRAVSDLMVVLAHPGGGKDEFLRRIACVAEHPNLHLDLSGSGIDRFGLVRKAVEVAGKDKILFGTDFPVNNPAVYVAGVRFEHLEEDVLRAVLHENFERLIGGNGM